MGQISVSLEYLLAIGAAVCFGIAPILTKRALAREATGLQSTLYVVGTRMILMWLVLSAIANSAGLFPGLTLEAIGIFALAGVTASFAGRMAYFVGIDRIGSTVCSAFVNIRPLLVVFLATIMLGEQVTGRMVIGVVVLVGGLVVLTFSEGGDIEGWDRSDLVFPMLAAMAFAAGNALRGFGLKVTPVTVIQAITINETVGFLLLTGLAGIRTGRQGFRLSRLTALVLVASGLVSGVGLVFLFEALDRGQVSIVDPISATAPLFTIVFGVVLLRKLERITRGVVAGTAFIVVGLVILTT